MNTIQTWVEVFPRVSWLKSLLHGNHFRIQGQKFHKFTEKILQTYLILENVNSRKPLPNEVTPHLPIEFHREDNLDYRETTMSGVAFVGQKIRPSRLCMHDSKPKRYSPSGIVMDTFSPLIYGVGSWLSGILQTLKIVVT